MSKLHDIPIDQKAWLAELVALRSNDNATEFPLALALYTDDDLLQRALCIADILLKLGLDTETIVGALIYPALQAESITLDAIGEQFNEGIRRLLQDVLQMQSLSNLQHLSARNNHQIENLRKMLLAMVTDVRAVLIVLAERLWQLRKLKHETPDQQLKLAQETIHVYAPLANRLGIWQLKWEIEDLCFRYLQPEQYVEIAQWLALRRQERETYIERMCEEAKTILTNASIKHVQVQGRVKHIYSIARKMERKNLSIEQIYDISGIRVIVDTIPDCYTVLGLLQASWAPIQTEFDDYIALPKVNGYRSIHTVVMGPEGKMIEIQIRTHEMHHESELGVAAHWRYKEGVLQTGNYEAKIALLRQIMAWQQEIIDPTDAQNNHSLKDLFADRIYVFTPTGDIVELTTGATPLDFAYHIHSEVGHRCRGAKVNGSIVPLTSSLYTGDKVEILTAKEAAPSRDWINPNYGYLKTGRARSKVQHWFRVKDSLQSVQNEPVRLSQLAAPSSVSTPTSIATKPISKLKTRQSNIHILGVNNLLTSTARCCNPLPGDSIIGYITRARGVSIHRTDCKNIIQAMQHHHARLVDVAWSKNEASSYPVDLQLRVDSRQAALRDITNILAAEKITIYALHTENIVGSEEFIIYLTIEVNDVQELEKIMTLLKKVNAISEVVRR